MTLGKMFRKIFFAFIIIALVSCGDDNEVVLSKEQYQKLIGDTLKPTYPKPFELFRDGLKFGGDGIVLGSDGHEYLIIDNNWSSSKEGTIEHYIDCVKCIERSKKTYNDTIQDTIQPH